MEDSLDKTTLANVKRITMERDNALSKKRDAELASLEKDKFYKRELKEKDNEWSRIVSDKDNVLKKFRKKTLFLWGFFGFAMLALTLMSPLFIRDLLDFFTVPIIWFGNMFTSVLHEMTGLERIASFIGFCLLVLVALFGIGSFIFFYRRRWNQLTLAYLVFTTGIVIVGGNYKYFINEFLLLWIMQIAYLIFGAIADHKMNENFWKCLQHFDFKEEQE